MKKVFLLLALLVSAVAVQAQSPQKGYRGFIDIGYASYLGTASSHLDIHTVHGYQFSQVFFAGVGLGLDLYNLDNPYLPVYLSLRTDIPTGKTLSPYVTGNIGMIHGFNNDTYGLYFAPEIGGRYSFSRHLAINAGFYMTSSVFNFSSEGALGIKLGLEF